MRIAFSWDDGAIEDKKLFQLHDKYEIPGMFFVPTKNREGRNVLSPEDIKKAESEYVSFGGHTYNHTYLTSIPIDQVENEIVQNKRYLECILEHPINDFCFPGGKYNQEILEIVYKHFKTARTADTMNFHYETGPLKPSFHFYPRGYKSLVGNAFRNGSFDVLAYLFVHSKNDYFTIIRDIIERESSSDKTIMIWGHSWEIEEFKLWRELENMFSYLSSCKRESIVRYEAIFERE